MAAECTVCRAVGMTWRIPRGDTGGSGSSVGGFGCMAAGNGRDHRLVRGGQDGMLLKKPVQLRG